MATKEQLIPSLPPLHMQLTTDEADGLRKRFSADLANVVPAKTDSMSLAGVTNVKKKPAKKKSARKTAKKGARKTTKKTGKKK